MAGEEKCRTKIDRHDAVPIGRRGLGEALPDPHARIVDKASDPALVQLQRHGDRAPAIALVAGVAFGEDRGLDLRHESLGRGLIAAGEYDAGPARGEPADAGGTDAMGPPGDDDGLAREHGG